MNTINTLMITFLSNDTLISLKKEIEYYLPEIIAEGLQKEYCEMIVAINQELANENRK